MAEMQQEDAIKASSSIMTAPEQAGSCAWRALDRGPCREGTDLSSVRAGPAHFILPL